MASWQSKVLNPLLRVQVKRKLRRAKTPADALKAFDGVALPGPKGVTFTPDNIGGVSGEWAQAPGAAVGTLLYLHGGGYFACSPLTHRAITGAFAKQGFKVFVPDYRLAPANPFPAAVDDGLAVYKALLDSGIASARLAIGGDSAGGGLALATLISAKAAGLPMPVCALLFSPWTDLAGTGESLKINHDRDPMLLGNRLLETAEFYLHGADPLNPLASPLYAELAGLPPLLIQVGQTEVLRDDSTRLAARAQAAGVTVDISIWDGLPHVWQLFQMFLPEARTALLQSAAFAKARLA